jgi:hypothetical protein
MTALAWQVVGDLHHNIHHEMFGILAQPVEHRDQAAAAHLLDILADAVAEHERAAHPHDREACGLDRQITQLVTNGVSHLLLQVARRSCHGVAPSAPGTGLVGLARTVT